MAEKESLKKESVAADLKPKISNFSHKLFVFTKFVLGICFLPFVYSVTVSFLNQFSLIDKVLQNYFWWGTITLLIIYLFIWEPGIIYIRGQRLLELVFSFFKPLVRVAPYLLPIYTILLFIVYRALSLVLKDAVKYFVFLFGFSIALHLIFSAKTLRSKKEDFFKSNYIFGFSLIYIINLILFAFFLNVLFDKFSFVAFCNDSFQIAKGIFATVFNQLFVNKS